MKKISIWFLGLILLFVSFAWAGTSTTNKFFYKPQVGARGAQEKATFDAGLDKVDARLGKEVWVGDPNYGTTFQTAITAIGSSNVILKVPAGTHNISADLAIPANIALRVEKGATLSVATTKTLTINGGLEAGLYQIFSCTGTGKVVFGLGAVKEAYPEWWKASGDIYWHTALQQALDACETAKITIFISQDMSIHGNVYLGNTPLRSYGNTISVVADDSWTQLGAGIYKYAGAILCKSGLTAGYGLSTVKIDISGVKFAINRTSSTSLIAMLVFLENCTGAIRDSQFTTDGTIDPATYDITPLDMYAAVTDFTVDNCRFNLNFTGGHGGFWIRNFDTTNHTQNINLSNCTFRTSQADEPLAIFTGVASTVEKVNIVNCQIYTTGAARPSTLTIWSDNAGAVVKDVNIANLVIESTVATTTPIWQNQNAGICTNVQLNNVTVRTAVDTTSGAAPMIRGVDRLNNVRLEVTSFAGGNAVYGFYGCGALNNCETVFPALTGLTYAAIYCTQISNSPNLFGIVASCKTFNGNGLNGRFIDCETVLSNKITIGTEYKADFVAIWQAITGNVVYFEDNEIIDSEATPTCVYVFYKPQDVKYHINRNYYKGARTILSGEIIGVVTFDNNLLVDPTGATVKNTSYCASTSDPWTLWGGAYSTCAAFPVGHRVWKSDPAAGGAAGWVKIAAPGTAKANWVYIANNAVIP